MSNIQILIFILVIAIVTFLTRVLPFAIFTKSQANRPYIAFLGRYLPMAIIGMLVVYCFKGITPFKPPYAVSELIATLTVLFLHLYKRNLLFSIIGGTGIYMLLIQKIG